jgi:RNA polymerase sigma factor (TIGR02999 family)
MNTAVLDPFVSRPHRRPNRHTPSFPSHRGTARLDNKSGFKAGKTVLASTKSDEGPWSRWEPKPLHSMNDVTRILNAIQEDDAQAGEELIPLVYHELRALAASKMAREKPGQTLQATALVHEAYLRLLGNQPQQWNSRGHFFAAAAEAMRRILVENARRKQSEKHGGKMERLDWTQVRVAIETDDERLLLVHEALDKLEKQDPEAAELIKLRFFVGMSGQEAARSLGLPERSATRLWAYARAWLYKEINREI